MTIEEAIAHAKEQKEIFGGTHGEFLDMAIVALEKQIPKGIFQGEHRKCICGSFAVGEYCFKCGHKIDWSEVEEC